MLSFEQVTMKKPLPAPLLGNIKSVVLVSYVLQKYLLFDASLKDACDAPPKNMFALSEVQWPVDMISSLEVLWSVQKAFIRRSTWRQDS